MCKESQTLVAPIIPNVVTTPSSSVRNLTLLPALTPPSLMHTALSPETGYSEDLLTSTNDILAILTPAYDTFMLIFGRVDEGLRSLVLLGHEALA